jgi:hypothetical protein
MPEIIEIGPVPCNEACAQVCDENYRARGRAECRAFINQITRALGEPPEGVTFYVKGNPHDYGTYYEAAVKVDGLLAGQARDVALCYAYRCESDSPERWDDAAREELAAAGFPVTHHA